MDLQQHAVRLVARRSSRRGDVRSCEGAIRYVRRRQSLILYGMTPYVARLALALGLSCAIGQVAAAQAPPTLPDWSGTWRGTLTNFPTRSNAPAVEVTREIGAMPTADSTCAELRTTYREGGQVRGVKDYKLCRGNGPDDWYVDEGGGLVLAARWLGDALISPFKFDSLLLVSTLRLRGDVLEEEIMTADDKPAIKGPLSLTARSVQRLELRRVR